MCVMHSAFDIRLTIQSGSFHCFVVTHFLPPDCTANNQKYIGMHVFCYDYQIDNFHRIWMREREMNWFEGITWLDILHIEYVCTGIYIDPVSWKLYQSVQHMLMTTLASKSSHSMYSYKYMSISSVSIITGHLLKCAFVKWKTEPFFEHSTGCCSWAPLKLTNKDKTKRSFCECEMEKTNNRNPFTIQIYQFYESINCAIADLIWCVFLGPTSEANSNWTFYNRKVYEIHF